MTAQIEGLPPEQRAANVRLGLILGGLVILIIAAFMTVFASQGLPKSPEVVKEMEQARSARDAASRPTAPAAAPAAAEEPR
jgi:hypothetical protein